jgi:hypothetical protein
MNTFNSLESRQLMRNVMKNPSRKDSFQVYNFSLSNLESTQSSALRGKNKNHEELTALHAISVSFFSN